MSVQFTDPRRKIACLTAFLAILLTCGSILAQDRTGWKLVWSDEFNGTALDTNTWGFDMARGPNNDGFGSWSLEYFTDSPRNAFLTNGHLVIRALEPDQDRFFHSAQVTTQKRRFFQYGRIEARMKLPAGYGLWPGFCMFGTNLDSAGWPECGEIDVMELRGGDAGDSNRTVFGTVHYRNASQDETYPGKWTYETAVYRLPAGTDFSRDFHVFGITWDADKIVFHVDGQEYFTNWIRAFYKSEFRAPFHLYFNIKIGGEFYAHEIRSAAEVTAPFPQDMTIDWIRYYRR